MTECNAKEERDAEDLLAPLSPDAHETKVNWIFR
jgi:hypothetical protein